MINEDFMKSIPTKRMSTVEIIERLNQAKSILDVSDSRVDHLVWTMDEMIERLRRKDKEFRDALMAEARGMK
jgi:hypothetical protein|tara:strand:- start:959 stop:1174 length:216 start_codon:yes stop_codon:yes gene_type:complete